MQYRKLLNIDLELSKIGLGCASYWGNKQFSKNKAIDVVHHAIDAGVNAFDDKIIQLALAFVLKSQ